MKNQFQYESDTPINDTPIMYNITFNNTCAS